MIHGPKHDDDDDDTYNLFRAEMPAILDNNRTIWIWGGKM